MAAIRVARTRPYTAPGAVGTARVARLQVRIYEVPISYHGRTYAEGKKIGWRDGVSAIWSILKFNTWGR